MTGHKLTYSEYRASKRSLRFRRVATVAEKQKLSIKTILQIRGSKTYEEYKQQSKAQHPPVKYSLAEEVLYIHKLTFDKGDNKYLAPKTAQIAAKDMILEIKAYK